MLCLGFKANISIRTIEKTNTKGEKIGGKTARQYAVENNRDEIVQLLDAWEKIKHQTILTDFIVVWRKFIRDYEAVISDNKDSKQILFELDMEQKTAKVFRDAQRGGDMEQVGLPIDDSYMRQTQRDARAAPEMAPKPWERKDWSTFVEKCEENGIEYHLTEEEKINVQAKRDAQRTLELMGHGKKAEAVDKQPHAAESGWHRFAARQPPGTVETHQLRRALPGREKPRGGKAGVGSHQSLWESHYHWCRRRSHWHWHWYRQSSYLAAAVPRGHLRHYRYGVRWRRS